MAVYLFTFHAYRSWMPDHRRGFVQRGKGILKSNTEIAASYERRAKFDRVRFNDNDCRLLLDEALVVCNAPSREWRLHIGVSVFNHLHLLVSWENFVDVKRAKAVFHRALTVVLRDVYGEDRAWLARGGSQKRIVTRQHFGRLLCTYLPSHCKYGGAVLIPM